jgi:hypothetical protein
MDGSETVWLYLDLNEADWQRAATQVRSALWAAAWQGLAGVAVSCAAPPAEADRQPAIWHVLRDAVSEVALWRESRTRARVLAEAGAATTAPRIRPRLAAEALDGVVGPAPGCDLVLESHRRAFGTVLRVALAGEGAPLNRFESARHKVIDLASQLSAPAQSGRAGEPLYWRGMPLLEDGRVRWRIVAASGEQAWKTATGLQEFLQRTAGCAVPLSRAFPRLEAGGAPMPSLIWVITDGAGGTGLPEAVQSAIAGRSGAPLVTVQLKDGPRVAVLCDSRSLNALLRTFQRQTALYPTARQVQ